MCLGGGAGPQWLLLPARVSGRGAEMLSFQLSGAGKVFSFHPLSNFGL